MSGMQRTQTDRAHLLSTTSRRNDSVSREAQKAKPGLPQRQPLLSNLGLVTSLEKCQIAFQTALVDDCLS